MTNYPEGDVKCIRVNDLDIDNRTVAQDSIWRIHREKNFGKYKVTSEDLLYLTRGPSFGAYRLGEVAEDIIALFHFTILGPIDGVPVLSDYLWWILNERSVVAKIRGTMRGSAMSFIRAQDLARVEIPLPELDIQAQIARLALHRVAERRVVASIEAKKDLLCESALQKLVYGRASSNRNG